MQKALIKDIRKSASAERAKSNAWFFKTQPGQYGHGDIFVGLTSPQMRALAKRYNDLPLEDVQSLLGSKIHEERQIALIILTNRFLKTKNKKERSALYRLYLKNTKNINNWDLVDISAPHIVGGYLLTNPKELPVLTKLARSKSLWEKRIAIISTLAFIRAGDFNPTLKIAGILLRDTHDLIHKAVGWMLREVGNRDKKIEERFLRPRYKKMPRTMLRYAIEKFSPLERRRYLKGKI